MTWWELTAGRPHWPMSGEQLSRAAAKDELGLAHIVMAAWCGQG